MQAKLRFLSLGVVAISSSVFVGSSANAQFTAVTNGPVVADHGDSTGCAWGDFDNDGDLDLFVSNFGTPLNFLYRNNGDGSFTRVTTGLIATEDTNAEGAAWADYDNDGDLDLFVAVGLGGHDLLYRNEGHGTFTKVSSGPIVESGGSSRGCAWGDYDNDGYLDLFVVNERGENNFLFHNRGDGTFTRITTGSIVNDGGASAGCAWGDYDNDGFLDLFVANLNENNFLYHNSRDGTFNRITSGRIVSDGGASIGCAWGDYDNDGLLDLFVANRKQRSFLYHNEGNGAFTVITNGPFVNDIGYAWGPAWADYDNDGFLDLFVANGPPNGPGQNDFLYHNNGDGTFVKITTGVVVNDGAIGNGCAWGDYNGDGFLDLFVSNLNDQNNLLYRNSGNDNNWLTVRCVGQLSNRAGVGAKVRLKSTVNGQSRWQMREISGGSGYGSQSAPYAYFGLGATNHVELLRIEWPSGIVQEMRDVAARQFLTLVEPEARITPNALELQAGQSATFTVTTTLAPPVEFQWKLNGVALPGETNSTLLIAGVQTHDAGAYSVTVTQSATALSFDTRPASLTGPVVILQPPKNVNVRPGSNAVFVVNAGGISPIHYQWRFNGGDILGATNTTLAVTNCQLPDGGIYDVVVSNSFGPEASAPATLGILVNPVITVQPLSQSVAVGGSVTFSVAVTGSPLPFTFEWRRGSVGVVTGVVHGPMSFFTLANVQTNQAGNYRVVIKNAANFQPGISSSNAVLTVLADTDGDGLPDEWESAHGLDGTNSADATLDSDGDGMVNAAEYEAGTDPKDARSFLRIDAVTSDGANFWRVKFLAVPNRTYTVQMREHFGEGSVFRNVADVPAAPTNRNVEVTRQAGDFTTQQFFRLITPRQP
jgi:hypothetical protein